MRIASVGIQCKDRIALSEQDGVCVLGIDVLDGLYRTELTQISAKLISVVGLQHDLFFHIPAAGAAKLAFE